MVILNEVCVVLRLQVMNMATICGGLCIICSDKILYYILYNVLGSGVHMSSPVTMLLEECVKHLL